MALFSRPRGFTLIELLVVIAIIGILSAVVLAALDTARAKANFASIQETLHSVQTEAEIYYTSSANYGPVTSTSSGTGCINVGVFTDSRVTTVVSSLQNLGATAIECGIGCNGACYDLYVQSPSGDWCVNNFDVATSTSC